MKRMNENETKQEETAEERETRSRAIQAAENQREADAYRNIFREMAGLDHYRRKRAILILKSIIDGCEIRGEWDGSIFAVLAASLNGGATERERG